MITGKQLIGFQDSFSSDETFCAVNPTTGDNLDPVFHEGTADDVDAALDLAADAAEEMRGHSGEKLGALCDAIAAKLEAHKNVLLERCGLECGYPDARLQGEFGRTVNQMRLFGSIAREGAWLNAVVDHAEPERAPIPKPDVRSMMLPLGPVAVFGASNFPLALSCAGGDTASALAAGCPVVIKGHPSHPGTCEIAGRAIIEAVKECGFPEGTFSLIHGTTNDLGAALVKHPLTTAVGFTGSLRGGRALFDIAADREKPIPVYAEMGSFNPQYVLPDKLKSDPEGFAEALFGSVTLGNGQFCTNPGLVFVPEGDGLPEFVAKYEDLVASSEPAPMLNGGIQAAFVQGLENLEGAGVSVTRGKEGDSGFKTGPALAQLSLADFENNRATVEEEVFGPSTIVVTCPSADEYKRIAKDFPGQLATSIHGTDDDLNQCRDLVETATHYAGRVCINGFPTGIEICHAMHHGGPYPPPPKATSPPLASPRSHAGVGRYRFKTVPITCSRMRSRKRTHSASHD